MTITRAPDQFSPTPAAGVATPTCCCCCCCVGTVIGSVATLPPLVRAGAEIPLADQPPPPPIGLRVGVVLSAFTLPVAIAMTIISLTQWRATDGGPGIVIGAIAGLVVLSVAAALAGVRALRAWGWLLTHYLLLGVLLAVELVAWFLCLFLGQAAILGVLAAIVAMGFATSGVGGLIRRRIVRSPRPA